MHRNLQKIDLNYMLFLFQSYKMSEGVKECCEMLELRQELLNYYIQQGETEQVLQSCIEYAQSRQSDPVKVGELWIHALTYFTELEDSVCETYIERALDNIGDETSKKEQLINPIMVLEILQKKPKLKFKVIKRYLSDRLDHQDKSIMRNTKVIKDNLNLIKEKRTEIQDLRRRPVNIDQQTCNSCKGKITAPLIAFMCGHVYHEACIENDTGVRNKEYFCVACKEKFSNSVTKRDQFKKNALEPEKFMKDLSSKAKKLNVVADYYGKGMFTNLGGNREAITSAPRIPQSQDLG